MLFSWRLYLLECRQMDLRLPQLPPPATYTGGSFCLKLSYNGPVFPFVIRFGCQLLVWGLVWYFRHYKRQVGDSVLAMGREEKYLAPVVGSVCMGLLHVWPFPRLSGDLNSSLFDECLINTISYVAVCQSRISLELQYVVLLEKCIIRWSACATEPCNMCLGVAWRKYFWTCFIIAFFQCIGQVCMKITFRCSWT